MDIKTFFFFLKSNLTLSVEPNSKRLELVFLSLGFSIFLFSSNSLLFIKVSICSRLGGQGESLEPDSSRSQRCATLNPYIAYREVKV